MPWSVTASAWSTLWRTTNFWPSRFGSLAQPFSLVLVLLLSLLACAHAANTTGVAPNPNMAGELLQWLSRSLDLCTAFAWDSTPPSCRSKFAYWVYDDPNTFQSPDKLYIYGGLAGDFSSDLSVAPDASASILSDFWQLSFKLNSAQTAWVLEWEELSATSAYKSSVSNPGTRADAATWIFSNRLYMFGGFGSGQVNPSAITNVEQNGYWNEVRYYDLRSGKWIYVTGATRALTTATAWRRELADDSDDGVITPISALPAMSGCSAVVRTQPSYLPMTVLLVGGQRFGTLSNGTYFFDLSTGLSNASVIYPPSTPKERVGGVLYPSTSSSAYAIYYGGFTAANPLTDLTFVHTVTGSWTYGCDSSFCANKPHIPWCVVCLALLPTTDYFSGLRYATVFDVNSTASASRVAFGGQQYSSTETHWKMANWTVIAGEKLPYPPLPLHHCTQPNPNPQDPWTFQCVGDKWEATHLCSDCPIALTLTTGPAIQITGDWAPSSVSLSFQQGSLLNISGTFSLVNLTADINLHQDDFNALARNSVALLTLFESAHIDSLSIAMPPSLSAAMRSMSFTDGCTMRTLGDNPTWTFSNSSSSSSSRRESLGVSLPWKSSTMPNCSPDKQQGKKNLNVALVASLSAAGGVALIVLVAAFTLFLSHRVRSFFFPSHSPPTTSESTSSEYPTKRKSETGEENGEQRDEKCNNKLQHLRKNSTSSSKAATSTNSAVGSAPSSLLYNPNKSAVVVGGVVVTFQEATTGQGAALGVAGNRHSTDYIASTPRSDLDYESGLGSLDTSVQDDFVAQDNSFISALAGL